MKGKKDEKSNLGIFALNLYVRFQLENAELQFLDD